MGTYDEIYRVIDGLFLDKKEHSIQRYGRSASSRESSSPTETQ